MTRHFHLSCVLFVSSMHAFPRTGVFQGRGRHDRDVQRSVSDLLVHAARHATVCGGKLTLPSMSNSKPWTEVDVQLDQWTMWFETNPSPDSRPLTTLDRSPSSPPRRIGSSSGHDRDPGYLDGARRGLQARKERNPWRGPQWAVPTLSPAGSISDRPIGNARGKGIAIRPLTPHDQGIRCKRNRTCRRKHHVEFQEWWLGQPRK